MSVDDFDPTGFGNCGDCRFFLPNADRWGSCLRRAPTVVMPRDLTEDEEWEPDFEDLWPTVADGYACGEWEAVLTPPANRKPGTNTK